MRSYPYKVSLLSNKTYRKIDVAWFPTKVQIEKQRKTNTQHKHTGSSGDSIIRLTLKPQELILYIIYKQKLFMSLFI